MAKPEIINLARDAARGRKGAFDELCRRKQRDIAFAAYTMLGNYHDAEDAAQETILTMYRYIGKLKAPEAIDVWIEKIVRNRCSEILKKRTGRKDEVDVD
ncbi:MAG: hypothetical protein LBN12_03460, partial [Clostridiales Family XIII bacterium]|nr:hypothetical protein [Clostridiales Family XIII bacterium]